MPELSLDDDQRDALVRHLDRVRVPQLVRAAVREMRGSRAEREAGS